MKPFGKMSKGKMRIQLIANLNVVFKFMKTTTIRLNLVGENERQQRLVDVLFIKLLIKL
jgi:hypothetical protein